MYRVHCSLFKLLFYNQQFPQQKANLLAPRRRPKGHEYFSRMHCPAPIGAGMLWAVRGTRCALWTAGKVAVVCRCRSSSLDVSRISSRASRRSANLRSNRSDDGLPSAVGLSFDQRQAQWRIDLFWQQLQALSARSCRSLERNLHSSGYTQSTCSQGGGPCEGFAKRWRTTTTSVRGV